MNHGQLKNLLNKPTCTCICFLEHRQCAFSPLPFLKLHFVPFCFAFKCIRLQFSANNLILCLLFQNVRTIVKTVLCFSFFRFVTMATLVHITVSQPLHTVFRRPFSSVLARNVHPRTAGLFTKWLFPSNRLRLCGILSQAF